MKFEKVSFNTFSNSRVNVSNQISFAGDADAAVPAGERTGRQNAAVIFRIPFAAKAIF